MYYPYSEGDYLFESICVVGERGQITLPKTIRELWRIKGKDKLIVKIENQRVVVEKYLGRKELEKKMIEGYKKMAKLDLQTAKEWEHASKEADAMLDD